MSEYSEGTHDAYKTELTQHLADKIQAGEHVSCFLGEQHDLKAVLDAVYVDSNKCEELNEYTLRLAAHSLDPQGQEEVTLEFNTFIDECCIWYVEKNYDDIEKQYREEQEDWVND